MSYPKLTVPRRARAFNDLPEIGSWNRRRALERGDHTDDDKRRKQRQLFDCCAGDVLEGQPRGSAARSQCTPLTSPTRVFASNRASHRSSDRGLRARRALRADGHYVGAPLLAAAVRNIVLGLEFHTRTPRRRIRARRKPSWTITNCCRSAPMQSRRPFIAFFASWPPAIIRTIRRPEIARNFCS